MTSLYGTIFTDDGKTIGHVVTYPHDNFYKILWYTPEKITEQLMPSYEELIGTVLRNGLKIEFSLVDPRLGDPVIPEPAPEPQPPAPPPTATDNPLLTTLLTKLLSGEVRLTPEIYNDGAIKNTAYRIVF